VVLQCLVSCCVPRQRTKLNSEAYGVGCQGSLFTGLASLAKAAQCLVFEACDHSTWHEPWFVIQHRTHMWLFANFLRSAAKKLHAASFFPFQANQEPSATDFAIWADLQAPNKPGDTQWWALVTPALKDSSSLVLRSSLCFLQESSPLFASYYHHSFQSISERFLMSSRLHVVFIFTTSQLISECMSARAKCTEYPEPS
jgi:hypothetical protein